jgi:hypothetical protein
MPKMEPGKPALRTRARPGTPGRDKAAVPAQVRRWQNPARENDAYKKCSLHAYWAGLAACFFTSF